eukprot:354189-Chlamydomonas_euryale.AAC.2
MHRRCLPSVPAACAYRSRVSPLYRLCIPSTVAQYGHIVPFPISTIRNNNTFRIICARSGCQPSRARGSVGRAVHTSLGRQERKSNAATARRYRSTRRVAAAALIVFQTSHLYYQRSSDEAADLAASMLVFKNCIALHATVHDVAHHGGEVKCCTQRIKSFLATTLCARPCLIKPMKCCLSRDGHVKNSSIQGDLATVGSLITSDGWENINRAPLIGFMRPVLVAAAVMITSDLVTRGTWIILAYNNNISHVHV